MQFEFDTKEDNREPVAYLAYSHIWINSDDGGLVCLCSDHAAESKVFHTDEKDFTHARDYREFYPGDKLTITF